jgi:hypothetical protein
MPLHKWITILTQKVISLAKQPIYPLLFALFPALFLYQHNADELSLPVLVNPILASLVLACLLLLGFNLLFRNWYKSAAAAMVALVVFFVYQPLVLVLPETIRLASLSLGRGKLLLPLTLLAVLTLWFVVWRSRQAGSAKVARLLNLFVAVLLLGTLVQIGGFETGRYWRNAERHTVTAAGDQSTAKVAAKPDVYYFIFDRYAGDKTLSDYYHFDNSPFLDGLAQRGFYIAHDSHTNYPSTELSISSSLSMDYHDRYDGTGPHPDFTTDVYPKIWDAEVAERFKSMGYHYYQIASHYMPTSYSNVADRLYTVPPQSALHLDGFSTEFLQTTFLNAINSNLFNRLVNLDFNDAFLHAHQSQQQRVPQVIQLEGPKLVFTHVLLPHDPYVVNSQCQPIAKDKQTRNTNLPAYLDQLGCANKLATAWVDDILKNTNGQAIIIVQADEGPYPLVNLLPQQKNFTNASTPAIQERTRILNAYYFPDRDYSQLYQSITPVNSFRTVLRQYFGQDIQNLEDKTFVFPSEEDIFEFIDATSKVESP